MNIKELNGNSLSFIGDAVYTLRVRQYFLEANYHSSNTLQKLCNKYNSAKGQEKAYLRMVEDDFFTEDEIAIYKRGRNAIKHIPKNGDLKSYEIASGVEAVCGYLYLTNKERLEAFFAEVFKGGIDNEWICLW